MSVDPPTPDEGAPWLLRRALGVVARKDAGAFRQAVFADVARHRPAVRLARGVHALLGRGRLSSLMIAAYGLKSFLAVGAPARGAPILTAAAYRNERRQLDYVGRLLAPGALAPVELRARALLRARSWRALASAAAHPRDLRRAWRVVDRVNRRADFLVACRVASTLGYYLRLAPMMRASGARAVLVSSDCNPYALGLTAAARRHGRRSIYITHGHVPDGPPPLTDDLAIFDGPAVLETYRESGPVAGAVVFKGAEGRRRPMDTAALRRARPTLGVFLSLIHDWPRLGRIFAELQRALRPERVVLRFHPNELVRPPRALRHLGRWDNVTVSYGESLLLDDASRCDLVIAGNSSCHLTLLKFGVPTAYVRGLDAVPHDFYRFLRHRIVPDCERAADLDPARVADFYDDPAWPARFAFFDASYLAGDRDAAVRDAITALVPEAAP